MQIRGHAGQPRALPRPVPGGARSTASLQPLIGVVGEIFCRLHTFSNEDLVRRMEEYGGEGWTRDITEWVWYTNSEQFRKLKLNGRLHLQGRPEAWIRKRVQHRDEQVLLEPFNEEFVGYEEPDIHEVLEYARPYLPADGALGEMVLNVGKAVYLAKKGADGIIDISPFTCMNGIVCEAIYPASAATWAASPSATSTSTAPNPTWTATWASTSNSPAATSTARSGRGGRVPCAYRTRIGDLISPSRAGSP